MLIYGYQDKSTSYLELAAYLERDRIRPFTVPVDLGERLIDSAPHGWRPPFESWMHKLRYHVFEIVTPSWLGAAEFFDSWDIAYYQMLLHGADPAWPEDVWRALKLIPLDVRDLSKFRTAVYLLTAKLRSERSIAARQWLLDWAASKPSEMPRPFLPMLTAPQISTLAYSSRRQNERVLRDYFRRVTGEFDQSFAIEQTKDGMAVVVTRHARSAADDAALEDLVI